MQKSLSLASACGIGAAAWMISTPPTVKAQGTEYCCLLGTHDCVCLPAGPEGCWWPDGSQAGSEWGWCK